MVYIAINEKKANGKTLLYGEKLKGNFQGANFLLVMNPKNEFFVFSNQVVR